METEYISRDKINEVFDGIWDCADMVFEPDDHCCAADDCGGCKWVQTKNAIKKKIDQITAADVRPVVRGAWKPNTRNPYWLDCTVCGYGKPAGAVYNFCPGCGADNRLRERAEREAQRRALLAGPLPTP